MKNTLLLFFFLLCITSTDAQVGNLIWEDNFDNGELDLTKWNYETGTGVNGDWGTGQLDRATDRMANVSFQDSIEGASDGCLVITTRNEFFIDRNYTSGRITSQGKASWGPGHRIAAKVFLRDVKQKGQGFAFWMMPDEIPNGWDWIMWPQGGEIDIIEYVGSIPYHNLGGVHYAWSWEDNQWQSWNHGHLAAYYSFEKEEVPNPPEPGYGGYPPVHNDPNAGSSGFHIYGIDWYDNRIEFFIDDNVYHIHYLDDGEAFQQDGQDESKVSVINDKRVGISEYSNHFEEWHPFEHKMFAILSAGVGGGPNTYGGAIIPEAEFPCSVFIDWVRVYELVTNVGIDKNVDTPNINIFPNPTNNIINFQIDNKEKYVVQITDTSGKTVIRTILDKSSAVDISNLEKGTYMVLLSNGEFSLSKKIIIQ